MPAPASAVVQAQLRFRTTTARAVSLATPLTKVALRTRVNAYIPRVKKLRLGIGVPSSSNPQGGSSDVE